MPAQPPRAPARPVPRNTQPARSSSPASWPASARVYTLLLALVCALALLPAPAAAQSPVANKVYLIRHAEKPEDRADHGLSVEGERRAACLAELFGPASPFGVAYILAQHPHRNGARSRPLLTVQPLADALALTVDTSCSRDDPQCVGAAVAAFARTRAGGVFVSWQHDTLTDIAAALGVAHPPKYPHGKSNIVWTVQDGNIVDEMDEKCPGLDDRLSASLVDQTEI